LRKCGRAEVRVLESLMRKSLGLLLVPLLVAACGQSMQPFTPFDSGAPVGDDLSTGGGGASGHDMAGAKGDMTGFGDGGQFDSDGPTITISSPTVGSFVSGFFAIKADISDPSGVDPSSVIAEFGNINSTDITLTATSSGRYEGVFDVRDLASNYVLAEISVRAKDKNGNLSQVGEEVVIDSVKPWMTMDSSKQMYVSKNGGVECSHAFSPIGTDAAHDGQVVPQIITLRARIEDHGNLAPGLKVERYSTVDPATVQMFVIHDDGQTPLAVDTDNDNLCDDVNPLLIPTAGPVMMQNEALSLQLVPMTAGGTPDFTPGGSPPVPSTCTSIGDAGTTTAPKKLCFDAAQDFTYELQYGFGLLPAIYTLPLYKPGDPNDCVGFQLDAANQLPEGPACVITRAADFAGNVQVSYPLHICIDMGGGKCAGFTSTPSHCTGVYDKATMMLKSGTCAEPPQGVQPMNKPATFPDNGVEFVGP
jgi:hypothetical protein